MKILLVFHHNRKVKIHQKGKSIILKSRKFIINYKQVKIKKN